MPESAQKHGHHQVDVGANLPLSVSAEWDVEVLAKPGGEGNVPPAPKLRDGR